MAKKKTANVLPKLTEVEQDLLSHMLWNRKTGQPFLLI